MRPTSSEKLISIRDKKLFIMDINPDSFTSFFIVKFNIGTNNKSAKPSKTPPIIRYNKTLQKNNLINTILGKLYRSKY